MIKIRRVRGEDKKEHDVHDRLPISSGNQIQWSENTKCITVIQPDGTKLLWEGSLSDKRLVTYITSSGQFSDFIHILTNLMAINIELIESGRNHTTYQIK